MPSSSSNNNNNNNNNNNRNNSGGSGSRSGGGGGGRTQPISDYEFLKPWGGMQNFMLANGLKMWEPDDVEEAHRIIDMMREQGGHGRSPNRS